MIGTTINNVRLTTPIIFNNQNQLTKNIATIYSINEPQRDNNQQEKWFLIDNSMMIVAPSMGIVSVVNGRAHGENLGTECDFHQKDVQIIVG